MKNSFVLKFLKKILLILIPVYILWFFYIEFMPMYYNRPTNTRWYFLKQSLDKKILCPKANILFLGESRVNAGIDFTQFPNSLSFASGGSSPIEMYYVLKKYISSYEVPDTVFFSVSPRFLSETFAFYPYAVRNGFFDYQEFNEICSNLKRNDTTIGKHPKFKFLLYKADYIEYYQSDVFYNNVFAGYNENQNMIKTMKSMNGGRPHPDLKDSCSELNYETKYTHFTPSPILILYFDKIFELCKDQSIFMIFEFMPMNESSYNILNERFVCEYRIFIKYFEKKYPGFIIKDTVYSYPDIYFGDASHLNLKGKEKYTEYLKSSYFN